MTNRRGETVTTAVTNLDIHDIARSCRTYGVRRYFLVTPILVQHELVGRILGHWRSEQSQRYHPDRFEALSRVSLAREFDEVRTAIAAECGEPPEVVLTDARPWRSSSTYSEYRSELERADRTRPALICFGTGWGVAESFHPEVDRILVPVHGPRARDGSPGAEEYNHLSVRAAAAIILDRLLGSETPSRQ